MQRGSQGQEGKEEEERVGRTDKGTIEWKDFLANTLDICVILKEKKMNIIAIQSVHLKKSSGQLFLIFYN